MPHLNRVPAVYWIAAAWLAAALGGVAALSRYESLPGKEGKALSRLPASTEPRPAEERGKFTLVLFAHPKCGCTRATLTELEAILREARGRIMARVHFYRPQGSLPNWSETPLRDRAAGLPGVTVVDDEAGAIARRFGAETSGQTYLYGPDGHLMFEGGITQSRGHEGASPGRALIAEVLQTERPASRKTRPFGCGLFSARERKMYNLKGTEIDDET